MEPSGSLMCPQKQTTGPYCGPKTGKPSKMEALTRSLSVSNVVMTAVSSKISLHYNSKDWVPRCIHKQQRGKSLIT